MQIDFAPKDDVSVTITRHTDPGVFEALHTDWTALLSRSDHNTVFATPEWHRAWWQAYQPGELYLLACHDDTDTLIGLAPWFIDSSSEQRVLRAVGCVDVTDYVDLVMDARYTAQVMDCMSDYLAQHRADFDRIELCNIPEDSPTYTHFSTLLQNHGFSTATEVQDVCPVITLPDAWDSYLSQLGKKDRHELRRKMRRAHGQGTIDWYTVDDTHDLDAELDQFLRLMADSDPEKAQFLTLPHNEAFFRGVMPMMFQRGWLKLHFLTINGEAAAAYLNFEYDGRVMVYNSGLWQEFASLSPGIVLLGHTIMDAIARGMQHFDFLRGNETYKYHMGGVDTRIYRLRAD